MAPVPTNTSPKRQRAVPRTDLNRYRLAMAILWTLVIMILCWLPGRVVQELEDGSSWIKIPNFDKVVHAGIFVVFSILWARALAGRRRFAFVALGGFALAIVTELLQKLPVVGRDGSIADALTDVAGVLVGLVVLPLVEPVARFIESRIFRTNDSQPVLINEPAVAVDGAAHPSN